MAHFIAHHVPLPSLSQERENHDGKKSVVNEK